MTDWPTIDAQWPYAGPCAFCGHPDKRHRLFDGLRGFRRAGYSLRAIQREYPYPLRAIKAVLAPKRCPLRRKVRA